MKQPRLRHGLLTILGTLALMTSPAAGVVEERLAPRPPVISNLPLPPTRSTLLEQESPTLAPRIHGTVYSDDNANGQRDPGEAGIAGAAVSDQANVVLTGADGAYELPADAGYGLVFVSVPDGYTVHGDFYARTSAHPAKSIDFALAPRATRRDFTFLHASDPHVSAATVGRLRRVGELAESLQVDFVLMTGDLVRDALRVDAQQAQEYYDLYTESIAKFTLPVWNVPGNHEIFGIERHLSLVSPDHPLYGEKMYRRYLGPNYYSFNYGGVHFIGLDSVDHTDLWYYGHIDDTQMEWLAADLAVLPAGTPVVTFQHIPFLSAGMSIWGYSEAPPAPTLIKIDGVAQFRHVVSNARAVIAMLQKHEFEMALAGHNHSREAIVYQTETGPVRFFLSAAIVGPAGIPELRMASGVTLYRVHDGRVDDGTFIRLDEPGRS